jgi:hypothetical protein
LYFEEVGKVIPGDYKTIATATLSADNGDSLGKLARLLSATALLETQ